MKIFMTLMMTMVITSAFADECKLNGPCKTDADCKAVNKGYALNDGKCTDPTSSQSDSKCTAINGDSQGKGESTAAGAEGTGAKAKQE